MKKALSILQSKIDTLDVLLKGRDKEIEQLKANLRQIEEQRQKEGVDFFKATIEEMSRGVAQKSDELEQKNEELSKKSEEVDSLRKSYGDLNEE